MDPIKVRLKKPLSIVLGYGDLELELEEYDDGIDFKTAKFTIKDEKTFKNLADKDLIVEVIK